MSAPEDPHFEQLLEFLRESRGVDFTGYKRSSLMRRTQRRMQDLGVDSYERYLDLLQADPDEYSVLFNTILINVTSFFRDPETWEYLRADVVPSIVARDPAAGPIRVWSAACASGEEAYSIAMLLADALGSPDIAGRVKIYATDIDEDALAEARRAGYDTKRVEGLPDDLRSRYIVRNGNAHTVRKELRRAIIFGRHNLASDPPISRVDLLLCRNVLMYFNAELQSRVLRSFQFALKPDGLLCLGKSEVMLSRTDRFAPVNLRRRVFRLARSPHYNRQAAMVPDGSQKLGDVAALQRLRAEGFESGDLPHLVVDASGVLALANRRARELFGIPLADVGQPLQDLPISYRPVELRSLLEQATRNGVPVDVPGVDWRRNDGTTVYLDVHVAPLGADGGRQPVGTLVSFVDVTRFHGIQEELLRSQREVETAYEELQSTVEELETTNEELQSTNEELETTNEELQSTNEELETMNEELQSTNEELATINDELRERSAQLNEVNFFFESVLLSLRAGVVVVDRSLRVTIWNRAAEHLWGLRADEVRGQDFLNLDIGLPVEHLSGPVRACLAGDSAREAVALEATNRVGRQIVCHVTCVPLTHSSGVDGVVLLMEPQAGA